MDRPLKLAILLCDIPVPQVANVYGSYTNIFDSLLKNSLPEAQFTLEGFDVVTAQEYPNLDDGYDGVLLSGSG